MDTRNNIGLFQKLDKNMFDLILSFFEPKSIFKIVQLNKFFRDQLYALNIKTSDINTKEQKSESQPLQMTYVELIKQWNFYKEQAVDNNNEGKKNKDEKNKIELHLRKNFNQHLYPGNLKIPPKTQEILYKVVNTNDKTLEFLIAVKPEKFNESHLSEWISGNTKDGKMKNYLGKYYFCYFSQTEAIQFVNEMAEKDCIKGIEKCIEIVYR